MRRKKARRGFQIFSLCCLGTILLFIAIYSLTIYEMNQSYYEAHNDELLVELRKFPYPYRAAMAICSDIDNTTTIEEFLEIQKFLNTTEMTNMGEGVGLEIGNSYLMYAPPTCCISYFSGDPSIMRKITEFIKSGYIDVLHSYGEKEDFSRTDAIAALKELEENGCKLSVWADHSKTIDNLGDDATFGLGDHPGSAAYHADLTITYGIRFVWLGRVTQITGQSTPVDVTTFTSIYNLSYPFNSFINVFKEFAKDFLAVFGNEKYAMHRQNELVRVTTLDDGQRVYEFIRFDNYWQGVATGANAQGLAYVISAKTLNRLKEVRGYMIVYTHLGKNARSLAYIPEETQSALHNLAHEYEAGNIYVTTTSKLLNYYVNHKYLNWSYQNKDHEIIISIHNVEDPVFGSFIPKFEDLQGITFYVLDKNRARIFIHDEELTEIQRNCADFIGRESVTIPLTFVEPSFRTGNHPNGIEKN